MKPLALLAVLLAACAPKSDPDVTRRLAAIDQELAVQHRLLDELKTAWTASPQYMTLLDRLDDLAKQVAIVEERVKPAARPTPSRREPDRAAVYAVPLGTSPAFGSPKAKVTLVMAMDFACPYCRKAWETVDELRKRYGSDLRVVYKAFIVHAATATYMASAACAANRQGAAKWRALADLLWTKAFDAKDYADAHVDELAAEAKLDLARYRSDIAGSCPQEVKDEQAQLVRLGITATPSFYINGRYLAGAMPIQNFTTIIDEELANARAAIKAGTKPESYYEQEVMTKGLRELAP